VLDVVGFVKFATLPKCLEGGVVVVRATQRTVRDVDFEIRQVAAVEMRSEIRGAEVELPSKDDHGLIIPSAIVGNLTERKCSGVQDTSLSRGLRIELQVAVVSDQGRTAEI
jgi:hypothetical protein